jgi:hypothetical protein
MTDAGVIVLMVMVFGLGVWIGLLIAILTERE